jgi:hypothetical protein
MVDEGIFLAADEGQKLIVASFKDQKGYQAARCRQGIDSHIHWPISEGVVLVAVVPGLFFLQAEKANNAASRT